MAASIQAPTPSLQTTKFLTLPPGQPPSSILILSPSNRSHCQNSDHKHTNISPSHANGSECSLDLQPLENHPGATERRLQRNRLPSFAAGTWPEGITITAAAAITRCDSHSRFHGRAGKCTKKLPQSCMAGTNFVLNFQEVYPMEDDRMIVRDDKGEDSQPVSSLVRTQRRSLDMGSLWGNPGFVFCSISS